MKGALCSLGVTDAECSAVVPTKRRFADLLLEMLRCWSDACRKLGASHEAENVEGWMREARCDD